MNCMVFAKYKIPGIPFENCVHCRVKCNQLILRSYQKATARKQDIENLRPAFKFASVFDAKKYRELPCNLIQFRLDATMLR